MGKLERNGSIVYCRPQKIMDNFLNYHYYYSSSSIKEV